MSVWHADRVGSRHYTYTSSPALIAQRDPVNRGLVATLRLSERHRDHLTGVRGLPPEVLPGFASVTLLSLQERIELARRVAIAAGPVAGVPGFYRDRTSWALVPIPSRVTSGFLIPILDHRGRIAAFQIRADDVPLGARRYTMLSSSGWDAGASCGVPVAVYRPDVRGTGCWITEGYLKGLIASDRLPACVLGIAGVMNWRPALELLKGASLGYPVTIAFDVPDLTTVIEVWRAREDLAHALHARGFAVSVATWNGGQAKGIDDALLAGVPVSVEPWRPTLAPAVARRSVALTIPERPASVPLMVATR